MLRTCATRITLGTLLVAGSACGKQTETSNPPGSTAAAPADDADAGDAAPADEGSDDAVTDESADEPAGDDAPDDFVREALLKLELVQGKTKIEHPGYMVVPGEAVTIVMTKDGHTHEVDFLFNPGEAGFDVEVEYRDNGKKLLSEKTTAEKQKWFVVKSGSAKLSLHIDPDAKRPDEVELGEGDDPLDSMD